MTPRALFAGVLLFAAASLAADRPVPIAVMPFKNLNADPSLEWLRAGMAETMLSDLKKLAKVPVVERDQLDKAMAEIALQGAKGTDESNAARIGKMVGAKTIVIGGLQQAGKQLRITARFVNVETGEVLDTAKATGTLDNVFGLQDEIVAKLIGTEVKKYRPVARKATPKTVKAYKLYAMALTTASDADRIGYLRQSVEEDPEFSYAVEDLAKLEKRIESYGKANAAAMVDKEALLAQELEDPNLKPEDRAQKAVQMLSLFATNQRWAALLRESEKIYAMQLPNTPWMSPSELASYYAFFSAMMLKENDKALKFGERHLKNFPGGTYYSSVEMQMRTIIDQRRDKEEKKSELDEKYAELEEEKAKAIAEARERKRELPPIRFMSWDFQRCSAAYSMRQFNRVLDECPKYLETWKNKEVEPSLADTAKMFAFQARYFQALAHNELGNFKEARTRFEKLIEEEPKMSKDYAVRTYLQFMPKE